MIGKLSKKVEEKNGNYFKSFEDQLKSLKTAKKSLKNY